jgi:transcription antitermination factor NusG
MRRAPGRKSSTGLILSANCPRCSARIALVLWVCKRPHPSEDGEALQSFVTGAAETAKNGVHAAAVDSQLESSWFALYTVARHEKRVAEHLSQRQIECYLPLYKAERRWSDGSRVTLELPLFPGYLFIHIQRHQRAAVLGVPGALAVVVGTGGEPAALPDATIAAMRAGLGLHPVYPHRFMTAGQRVRIRSGALAGLEGFVVRHKNICRVVLTLENIRQSFAVEVDLEDIEPVTAAPLSYRGRASEPHSPLHSR